MVELGTRRITRVAGTTIHWTELGAGRPLVLFHGLCDTHQAWRRVAPGLARDRRVIIPDLPGHGLSGRPDASYELEWYADVMGQWLDRVGVEELDLAGHSYGGGIAMWLLLSHADRIDRLALVSSGGMGREVSMGLRLLSLPMAERVVQPWMSLGTRLVLWAAARDLVDAEALRWHAWQNGAPGTGRALARTVRGVIGLRGQHKHFMDRVRDVPRLPPVALYWGDRDRILPFEQAERAKQLMCGVPLTRFAGCGHYPHLEQPERFATALRTFLADPTPGRARIYFDMRAEARLSWWRRAYARVTRGLRSWWSPWRRPRKPRALLPAPIGGSAQGCDHRDTGADHQDDGDERHHQGPALGARS